MSLFTYFRKKGFFFKEYEEFFYIVEKLSNMTFRDPCHQDIQIVTI